MYRTIGLILSCFGLFAQNLPVDGLPVKRIVLYKNGVGYFEHLGNVQGNNPVTVSFTSGQINDVLKSLTVLDLGGGTISGVGYGSTAPLDRRLGELRLPIGEKPTLTEFLNSLRGAKLEIRNTATAVTGRLLSIERKTRTAATGATYDVDYATLVTDSGDVRTTEVSPSFSMRLLEKGLTGKVDRYLDLASSAREPDVRQMLISTTGAGQRPIFVSYISEVPVWKSTYRIVMNAKSGKPPMLQGWAIVDNTVGQDWDKVEMSLVAGAPQSFIQNVSQPVYTRRPEVPIAMALNLAPQTYESTLIPGGGRLTGRVTEPTGAAVPGILVKAFNSSNELIGQGYTNGSGDYDIGGLPDGTLRLEIAHSGFSTSGVSTSIANGGTVQQNVTLTLNGSQRLEQMAKLQNPPSTLGSGAMLGRVGGAVAAIGGGSGGGSGSGVYNFPASRFSLAAAAQGQELGDLFEYKLKQPITIAKNRSALIPVIQSSLAAEKVSVWNEQSRLPRPMRALWLTNTSGLTLDGGTFSIVEEEMFAGEGVFDPIRPDEKRLISYAVDLALNATSKIDSGSQRVIRVRIAKGVMTQESEIRERKTYTFRNADATPRIALIEHPVRSGYELRSEVKPAETTAQWMRFRLSVPAKSTAALTVDEASPRTASWQVNSLAANQIAAFVAAKTIDKSIEDALRSLIAQKDVVDRLAQSKSELDGRMESIFNDQQRLRENLKALKGTAEEKALTQRYTQQLNSQEDQLERIRAQVKQLKAQQSVEQEKYHALLEAMVFDVKI